MKISPTVEQTSKNFPKPAFKYQNVSKLSLINRSRVQVCLILSLSLVFVWSASLSIRFKAHELILNLSYQEISNLSERNHYIKTNTGFKGKITVPYFGKFKIENLTQREPKEESESFTFFLKRVNIDASSTSYNPPELVTQGPQKTKNPSNNIAMQTNIETHVSSIPPYRIKVKDLKLLSKMSRAAYWANKAYCLTASRGYLGKGIYAHAEKDLHEVTVYIRGYYYSHQEYSKLDFAASPYPNVPDALVVSEFFNDWSRVKNELYMSMRKVLVGHKSLRIVGHGVGGVYAVYTALDWSIKDPKLKISAYTFGQPRMGNGAFTTYVNSQLRNVYRITHTDDPIPQFPKKSILGGYRHFEREFWIFYPPDCGCGNLDYNLLPTVFDCRGSRMGRSGKLRNIIEESKYCNAGHQTSHNLFIGISSHSGPYFGQFMGTCPED